MTDIPKRRLGRTGVDVTVLGFGAFELRGEPTGPPVGDREAEELLNAALDAGMNLIDTSIDYGRSEELVGRFISHRRSEYFLASKCGCVVGAAQLEHVHTAENVRRGVENSLRLLRTDHLDIVQFHLSLTREELERDGALEEAMKLRQEGKVRFVGSSGTLPHLLQQIEMGVFDVFQIPYSALQREHETAITKAAAAGAGTIIRGGVAKGAPTDWNRVAGYMVGPETMKDRWEEAKLDQLLDGMSRMEFMLRFTLAHPDLDAAIVGTKNLAHLRDNIEAAKKEPLPADLVAEAKRRLDAVGAVAEPV